MSRKNGNNTPFSHESDEIVDRKTRKRGNTTRNQPKAEIEDPDSDADHVEPVDMFKMFENFGSNLRKNMQAKQKRVEHISQVAIKSLTEKVDDPLKIAKMERHKLNEEYHRQFQTLLDQWNDEFQKGKEQEEKIQKIVTQQVKVMQQQRILLSQKLQQLQQLHEQYIKGTEELENQQSDKNAAIMTELERELTQFQKKIIMETQQKEMTTVRKSLSSLFC